MRRKFIRHLSTLVAGLSLLLFVAVCGLWMRSHRYEEGVRVVSPRGVRYAIVYSTVGEMMVGGSTVPVGSPGWPNGVHHRVEGEPEPLERGPSNAVLFDRWGFGMHAERPPYVVAPYAVWFPHWFAALVLLALPSRWLVTRVRRRARARRGLCDACGYDLRGTPERCPEFGAVSAKAAVALPANAVDRAGG